MIAAGLGHSEALKKIRKIYLDGYATKDDYATALRTYQTYIDSIKSVQRDKAAEFADEFIYY